MADFLLDLRPPGRRALDPAAGYLRFNPGIAAFSHTAPDFGLVLTQTGRPDLWSPYLDPNGIFVAIAGRPAFDAAEWDQAQSLPDPGGLAAKIAFLRYRQSGLPALESIGGNVAVILHDPSTRTLHLVTDCAGAFPVFHGHTPDGDVFGSHPDVVADAAGENSRLDTISLAEFLLTNTVTPPHTYYERVKAVDHASTVTATFQDQAPPTLSRHRTFDFSLAADPNASEEDLAGALAEALRRAVRRRTLPRLGTTAVALSGGLDSRALLACIEDPERVFAFTCYDQPNPEFRVAQAVAHSLGVRFLPFQRPFEYYGDHAAAGVRISGGMGTFANNHFLGVIDRLHQEGAENLLTGCYCDYLFKALPLNLDRHWLTGRERLGPFRHQFYFSHRSSASPLASAVRDRWEARIPTEFRTQSTPEAVFQVEARRTFPLCYEGDNQQRVVPQRLTGWALPVSDREVLALYRTLPYTLKLDRSIFLKAVLRLTRSSPVARVPDANTGARPGAHPATVCLASSWLRAKRKLRKLRPTLATEGSWPDWHHYVAQSATLKSLWERPNPEAFDLFRQVLGPDAVRPDIRTYAGRDTFLLVALLTLKLWFERRA
ncbi:MAG: hypothetical protein KF833_03895 [Verrucomicrobiae bacterium]|nr:hypothetical protein [Verrucomicrobiae bacterium]